MDVKMDTETGNLSSTAVQQAANVEPASTGVLEKELCPSSASSTKDDDASSIKSVGNQTNILTTRQLLVAFPALATALFVSMIDQTSVSTSIPAISAELKTGAMTSWIGSSFLLASCAFQLINGRLSDIFGRKNCLLVFIALLGVGDLICGFAKNKEMLLAARALAGVGGGGLQSVSLIIISDITTLEKRGKYQGILGAIIAMANGIGPFIGGAVVEKATWRWTFWVVPMLAIPAALIILFFLPLKHTPGHYKEKVKKVDFGGVVLNLIGVVMILVPLSGAGITYSWSSPFVIAMLIIGVALAVAFVVYECKVPQYPIMPLRLITASHCPFLYLQTFTVGLCFFGNFFYLPIYFQSVLSFQAIKSGAFLLPYIIFVSCFSIFAGQIMARTSRYMPMVIAGAMLWTIGAGLKCMFGRHTKNWQIIVSLVLEGAGTGFSLQPTLVALLANSRNEDRAVCTGLRNFVRTIGGSFGLVMSGAILSNTLVSHLSHLPFITPSVLKGLTSSTYDLRKLNLTTEQDNIILDTYMLGLHYIFVAYASLMGLNVLFCLGIGNTSLKKKTAQKTGNQADEENKAFEADQMDQIEVADKALPAETVSEEV